MKLDVLGVQAFVALDEQGSFGKAAESLFITQTALSRRLMNLEAFLGVKLVERTTRTRSLTAMGEEFLPQARRLLGELKHALVEIRERGRAAQGEVTIACVPTIGIQYLPRVVQAYAARHPGNRVLILDHASAGVELAVRRREAEFGIAIAGPLHDELAALPLLHDRFVLVCRDDHSLARRSRVAWAQLQGLPLIVPGGASSNRPLLDGSLTKALPQLRPQYEVQRSSTAMGLAAAGVAAAIVPSLALQPGTYPMLRGVALVDPVVRRSFVLLTRRRSTLSPAAQALFELVQRGAKVNAA